jgi:NAD-dependent deacetylase sirtuin 5
MEKRVLQARENKAHEALAQFSLQKTRDRLMPENKGSTFTLVTQNIDGLSTSALRKVSELPDASTEYNTNSQNPLLEMHGRLFDVSCTNCDHVSHTKDQPLTAALRGTEVNILDTIGEVEVPVQDLPKCESCGSLARPGTVLSASPLSSSFPALTLGVEKELSGSEKNLSIWRR